MDREERENMDRESREQYEMDLKQDLIDFIGELEGDDLELFYDIIVNNIVLANGDDEYNVDIDAEDLDIIDQEYDDYTIDAMDPIEVPTEQKDYDSFVEFVKSVRNINEALFFKTRKTEIARAKHTDLERRRLTKRKLAIYYRMHKAQIKRQQAKYRKRAKIRPNMVRRHR